MQACKGVMQACEACITTKLEKAHKLSQPNYCKSTEPVDSVGHCCSLGQQTVTIAVAKGHELCTELEP